MPRKVDLTERSIKIANYILENRATMKQTAEIFSVSVAIISTAIHQKLKEVDPALYEKVKKVCDEVKIENKRIAGQKAASLSKNKMLFGKGYRGRY